MITFDYLLIGRLEEVHIQTREAVKNDVQNLRVCCQMNGVCLDCKNMQSNRMNVILYI